jgi:hypothetical protein
MEDRHVPHLRGESYPRTSTLIRYAFRKNVNNRAASNKFKIQQQGNNAMKKTLLATAALMFAANLSATDLSFNNLSLSYKQADFDCNSKCDGLNLIGSLEFSPNFAGSLDYANYSGDLSLTYLSFDARHQFNETSAIYGQAGAARAKYDFSRFDYGTSTKGFLGVGVRSMLAPQFEGDLLVRKVFASGSDVSFKATGTYFFTDTVGASLILDGADGQFGGGIGLRLNF